MRTLALPLLGKELTERAARRRTYVVRVVYAMLLFGFFVMLASRILWGSDANSFRFGVGKGLLDALFVMQCFGIALFLPALMSGAITLEKERDSLVLLFLTDLKPREIILQKYLGGLVPMFTFLLLSLPLAAILYSLGGVTTGDIVRLSLILVLATLQVGAMALMCSAFAKSSLGALLGTYAFGSAYYACVPFSMAVLNEAFGHRYWDDDLSAILTPFLLESVRPKTAVGYALCAAPSVLSVAAFLLFARSFLVRRAFLPPGSFLLRWFGSLDGWMTRLNRFAGGVVLARKADELPGDEPVAWREVTRKALGRIHYLIRCVMPLETLVVLVCLMALVSWGGNSGQVEGLSLTLFGLWAVVALVLASQSANVVVSERATQTLDVLLATPLSGREIVLQKMRAVHRLAIVGAVPLATVIATEAWIEFSVGDRSYRPTPKAAYLVASSLSLLIYLPLTAWLAMLIGLRSRTRFRAILAALGAVAGWCAAPVLLLIVLSSQMRFHDTDVLNWMVLSSPIAIVAFNEFSQWSEFGNTPWLPILVNFAVYGAILLFVRTLCLRRADRYLGRA